VALPAGVTTATVTVGGAVSLIDGDPQSLAVTARPVLGGTATHIVHAATGTVLVPLVETYTPGATVSLTLPHVDQDGFVDGAGNEAKYWHYLLQVAASEGATTTQWTKLVQPLVGQASIDLDLVTDGSVTAWTSTATAGVTSVNGQTGAVTVAGGSTDWGDITDKPPTYPPAEHTHATSAVTSGQFTAATLPPGTPVRVLWHAGSSSWRYNGVTITARVESRTDLPHDFIGGAEGNRPAWGDQDGDTHWVTA
jgi:hypothetical protein